MAVTQIDKAQIRCGGQLIELPLGQAGGAEFVTRAELADVKQSITAGAIDIFVAGPHAGDTPIDGRGTAEFPYETLSGAIGLGSQKYPAAILNFILQDDVDDSGRVIHLHTPRQFNIMAKAGLDKKPAVHCDHMNLAYGYVNISGIMINGSGANAAINMYGPSHLRVSSADIAGKTCAASAGYGAGFVPYNCSFRVDGGVQLMALYDGAIARILGNTALNGSCKNVFTIWQRSVCSIDGGVVFSGSVTGKKYEVCHGCTLIRNGKEIPGTIAGTCDESSTVL